MPAKEYSCTINLGFVLKCLTNRSFTFRNGPLTPAFLSFHICMGGGGGVIDGTIQYYDYQLCH